MCSEPGIPRGGGDAVEGPRGQGEGDKTTENGLHISLIYEGLPMVVGLQHKKTLRKVLL